jgi:hypothetical protein
MPRVGFESMIPVFERAKKFHASDREATVISSIYHTTKILSEDIHGMKTVLLINTV